MEQNANVQAEQNATNVQAISLKLPGFWPDDAQLWFLQAESQFALRGIVQDTTKYHNVVSSLDQMTARRCKDILRAPPANEKYEALKASLLNTFELSEYERAKRILHMPGLGDSSPSKLMDDMLTLLGDHEPCFLFRAAFLERLPEEIRSQLISQ